ncbi:MAG: MCP four helix bundle domain-containing protein, partial [Spirochaetota bacterium]
MLKNMKLGLKMTLGFGLVILLVLIVGGIAILNMLQIQRQSVSMKDEYVPEVAIANNVERSSLLTMYNMRGYVLSFQESFLLEGNKYLDEVFKNLEEAATHADMYTKLTVLKEGVATAKQKATEYKGLAEETKKTIDSIENSRKELDKDAADFMENCYAHLNDQNEKL